MRTAQPSSPPTAARLTLPQERSWPEGGPTPTASIGATPKATGKPDRSTSDSRTAGVQAGPALLVMGGAARGRRRPGDGPALRWEGRAD